MRALLSVVLSVLLSTAMQGAEHPTSTEVPVAEAALNNSLIVTFRGNESADFTASVVNNGPQSVALSIPAGTIFSGKTTSARVVTVRGAIIKAESGRAVDATLPVAALSVTDPGTNQAFVLTEQREPKLNALLSALETKGDLPRETSQLAVFALLENIDFPAWCRHGAIDDSSSVVPTPAQIVQAIDALGILKAIAPGQTFALQTSNDLKLHALRNPVSRAKAMWIFGISAPDDLTTVHGVAPDISQLLHTKAGDNCPICRMRQGTAQPSNDL